MGENETKSIGICYFCNKPAIGGKYHYERDVNGDMVVVNGKISAKLIKHCADHHPDCN